MIDRYNDKEKQIIELSKQIWSLSKDKLLVNLRFLDNAISSINIKPKMGANCVYCAIDETVFTIFYEPGLVLSMYKKKPANIIRMHFHILMHGIFSHAYKYDRVDKELWDVATDMAVENVILGLGVAGIDTIGDVERIEILDSWKQKGIKLTAECIYKALAEGGYAESEIFELGNLFKRDSHIFWDTDKDKLEITKAQWQKISERVKADLKSFSRDKTKDSSMLQNLEEATKEEYDYEEFLRKFCVAGEDMQINDDEFDYVYYTYGLSVYGNMPLVEPLEYKDVKKIKEFVIALDTSASCRESIVNEFLNKTYNILQNQESFFNKVNIHILQCDSDIRSITKITSNDEFEAFMKNGRIEGLGSTDFRPVFEYVNTSIEAGEFENLRGLIYFTDGYGVFPEKKPPYDYETAFVFLEDNYDKPPVPVWAIKVVLPMF